MIVNWIAVATNIQNLVDSMLSGQMVKVVYGNKTIIDSVVVIEKEDGSGKNYNIIFTHSKGKGMFVDLSTYPIVTKPNAWEVADKYCGK